MEKTTRTFLKGAIFAMEGFSLPLPIGRCGAVALAAEVIALAFDQFFPTLVETLGCDRTVTLVLAAEP